MITRITSVLALAVLLGVGCAPKGSNSGTAANPMADSMKAANVAMDAAWDAGNGAEFDKYITADYVEHNPAPGQKPGLGGLKEFAAEMKAAFPDLKSTVEDMRVDGDVIVSRVSISGTNSGPMFGMPPTGKKMTNVSAYDIMRWKDGKFVEHWGLFDDHAMMQQLGLAPPMSGAPATGAPMNAKPGEKKM